jgi:hypothetical protein
MAEHAVAISQPVPDVDRRWRTPTAENGESGVTDDYSPDHEEGVEATRSPTGKPLEVAVALS